MCSSFSYPCTHSTMQRCWNTLYLHLSEFLFYVFIKIKNTRGAQFHAFFALANVFVADRLFRLYFPFVNSPENGGILAVLIICLQPPLMEDSFAFARKNLRGLERKALRFGKLEIRLPFTFDEFASKRRVLLKVVKVIHVSGFSKRLHLDFSS